MNPVTPSLRIAILVRRLPFEAHTKHLRLFAANPTRKPNAAANSADAHVEQAPFIIPIIRWISY